ncbi:MAG: hypothetical protein BJBARM5_0095 [Candidatus Parvarchaeum acidophilus ARMAN-5]|uniref:Uncharacterized protein n=1 Tax=Candidatus Parvarchaeum acidophilus ARMAN-5 TaxID=662762 RepID=D6GUG0_PARA5|nr:MAG: hypothetical protein BJBARM5_0095 [Candidatus Parvarchaeum acidophilus ARMAN-5]
MAIERASIPAVVILILMLIAAVVIYIRLVPPPVAYKLLGINNTTTTKPSIPTGEYYAQLNTYLGGNSKPFNTSYAIGTFAVDYPILNTTVFNKTSVSIGSSILGSSSYNIDFNGSQQSTYFIEVTVKSVSGSPKMSFSLNGNSFFSTIPAKTETIIEKIPGSSVAKDILSITDSLNGFAFTQSFTLSSIKVIQETGKNRGYSVPVKVLTFSGIGDYSLDYTPIGYGSLTVSINNQIVSNISSGQDSEQIINIPSIVISKAIRNSNESNSVILPVSFNVVFQPAKNVSYEIADASMNYNIPFIAENSPTLYYSVNAVKGNYILTLDVNSIIKSGNVYLYFTPSGKNLTMNSSSLSSGENVLLIPSSYLGNNASSGNYSGTIELSSNGLVIPSYISLKSVVN